MHLSSRGTGPLRSHPIRARLAAFVTLAATVLTCGIVAAPAAIAAPLMGSGTAPASLTIGGVGSGLLPVGGVGLLVLFGIGGAALVASRGRDDV